MVCNRLFLVGLIVLFLGIQFRLVKTYELNPTVSRFIEDQVAKRMGGNSMTSLTTTYDGSSDLWSGFPTSMSTHSFSPPSWLGWTFVSAGAVLVLICPCYR